MRPLSKKDSHWSMVNMTQYKINSSLIFGYDIGGGDDNIALIVGSHF